MPDLISSYRWFGISSGVAVISALVLWRSFRPPSFHLRQLAQLGGMLGLFLGLGSTMFVLWDMWRTPTIVVGEERLLIGNETLDYTQVSKAYLRPVPQQDRLGTTTALDIAVIELADGRQWLLSGKQYDASSLIRDIRSQMDESPK